MNSEGGTKVPKEASIRFILCKRTLKLAGPLNKNETPALKLAFGQLLACKFRDAACISLK